MLVHGALPPSSLPAPQVHVTSGKAPGSGRGSPLEPGKGKFWPQLVKAWRRPQGAPPLTPWGSGGEGQLASTGHRDEVHEARVCEVCGVRCDCEAPSTRGGRNEGGPGRGPRRGPMGETSISGPALQAPDQIMPPRQD